MADVINLNHYRKAKRHAEKEQKASENRAKFGRAQFEKLKHRSQEALDEGRFLGHSLKEDDQPASDEKCDS